MKRLGLIISLISIQTSFAFWPKKALNHVAKYKGTFRNTFAATMYGYCHSPKFEYEEQKGKVLNVKIPSQLMNNGFIEAMMGIQTDKKGQAVKAPVMLAIPGAFSNLKDKQSRRMFADFMRLGYHVIILPNPWGTQMMSYGPKYMVGNILKEGQSAYKAFRTGLGLLKGFAPVAKSVNIFGISYGAYLSAMISGMDTEHKHPIINGTISLVSAPKNLRMTLSKLDSYIEEQKDKYANLGLGKLAYYYKRVCGLKPNEMPSEVDLKRSQGLAVFLGFHAEFVNSIKTFSDIRKDLNLYPKGVWNRVNLRYRRWVKNLNFEKYLEEHAPDALDILRSEKGEIDYWLNKIQNSKVRKELRILTSDDDYLNSPGDWADESSAIVLPSGGHYGFRSTKWYSDFINFSY